MVDAEDDAEDGVLVPLMIAVTPIDTSVHMESPIKVSGATAKKKGGEKGRETRQIKMR